MSGPSRKRQKREDYRAAVRDDSVNPQMPQKKFYRSRAHANPFSDHNLIYPPTPDLMDWTSLYPGYRKPDSIQQDDAGSKVTAVSGGAEGTDRISKDVEVVDIGCGFGGLLMALAPAMPDTLILGLEIRVQVSEFVQDKIRALRAQHESTRQYQNIACLRANTMKFLPNFFRKAQLSKIFICFPDPHFKARKHKARIVSTTLNSEYAFVLRPGGIVYTITDVPNLHEWMVGHFDAHPSFERVGEDDVAADECARIMMTETEEGKKVERNQGKKLVALYRRLEDPPWPEEEVPAGTTN